uniref:Scavenger receptor class B member 1 n=2 Tax=Culicoides sonorensis TaxID=179676 RepID=A0A336MNJ0_CULSO
MHGRKNKLCTKLSSNFLRKWWLVIAFSLFLILIGVFITFGFQALLRTIIDSRVALRQDGESYQWWSKPPVEPVISVYVYNVTNADDFLNNGTKPVVDELGPYVYVQKWEKVNIVDNKNGTLSFNYKRTYRFDEEKSGGSEDDLVIVPNIPMLSATSQSKHAARFLRLAMASIMDILKIKPFVEVSVGQLLWGYEDPLLKLAKDVVPKEQKLPYDEFGLMYGKNATHAERVTVWTGVTDITKFGIIERYNGKTHLSHWTSEKCNRLNGSDGSIFPPHITKEDTLFVFEKDLCRLLPLKFEKEVSTKGNITGYRFTPDEMVFASVDKNPDNLCFCPSGPPCAPNGLFNVSLCQYDSPVLLSFPHFYLADDSLRTAVDGISPPEKDKHQLFIDVQPDMGTALRGRARIQINLAVSQVVDIKQVATFPDIVFPILWFEEGIDGLPDQITNLMQLATNVAPQAQAYGSIGMFVIGLLLFIMSVYCLIRNSHRQSTLHLESSNYLATASVDQAKKKAKMENGGK